VGITIVIVGGFLIALGMVLYNRRKTVKISMWFTKWGGFTAEVEDLTLSNEPGRRRLVTGPDGPAPVRTRSSSQARRDRRRSARDPAERQRPSVRPLSMRSEQEKLE